MRVNGVLSYLVSQDASFNEDGEPVQGVSSWSNPIGCFIVINSHSTKGKYQDGRFTQASYEFIIERQNLGLVPSRVKVKRCFDMELISRYLDYFVSGEEFNDLDGSKLRVLEENNFDDLGEWEVQNFQPVSLDRFKITV